MEKGTKKCLLLSILTTSADTLEPIILQSVTLGIIIINDGWAYGNLSILSGSIYNHQEYFMYPHDTIYAYVFMDYSIEYL